MIKFENGKRYKYEHMDLVALCACLNTIAIIAWDKGAYVGLPVNIIGLILDLRKGCHFNNVIMRLALIVMNIFFLL